MSTRHNSIFRPKEGRPRCVFLHCPGDPRGDAGLPEPLARPLSLPTPAVGAPGGTGPTPTAVAPAPADTMGGSFSRSGSFPFLSSGAAAATTGGVAGEGTRPASLMSGRAAGAPGGGSAKWRRRPQCSRGWRCCCRRGRERALGGRYQPPPPPLRPRAFAREPEAARPHSHPRARQPRGRGSPPRPQVSCSRLPHPPGARATRVGSAGSSRPHQP
ncbi:hypothetical protein P7K49_024117 [Saguinus oedipus]|uniref:Uncharacterized protein n=1 Tax=Saguinus oedipus TaxID=9490 RepID=A0ABQ9UNK4_SAGOE|nr:hypothetical protein P7K49_024117 [Saguinus oedipus]